MQLRRSILVISSLLRTRTRDYATSFTYSPDVANGHPRRRSKLGAILRLDASDLLVSPKVGVPRHVGRVLAGLRVTAESLCQSTDVMRASAAADSEIADAEIEGFAAEFTHFRACAQKRVESGWKRPRVAAARVCQ